MAILFHPFRAFQCDDKSPEGTRYKSLGREPQEEGIFFAFLSAMSLRTWLFCFTLSGLFSAMIKVLKGRDTRAWGASPKKRVYSSPSFPKTKNIRQHYS